MGTDCKVLTVNERAMRNHVVSFLKMLGLFYIHDKATL